MTRGSGMASSHIFNLSSIGKRLKSWRVVGADGGGGSMLRVTGADDGDPISTL